MMGYQVACPTQHNLPVPLEDMRVSLHISDDHADRMHLINDPSPAHADGETSPDPMPSQLSE